MGGLETRELKLTVLVISKQCSMTPLKSALGDVAHLGASVMDKLQRLIDTAFGRPAAERAPQAPNEYTLERQRAFDESAKKIEALRRARMAQQTN